MNIRLWINGLTILVVFALPATRAWSQSPDGPKPPIAKKGSRLAEELRPFDVNGDGKLDAAERKAVLAAKRGGSRKAGAAGGSIATGKRSPFVPREYELTWSDEFDGAKLDSTKWAIRYPGKRDGATTSEAAVSLDGKGNLLLTTSVRDGELTTGQIGTQKKFEQKFGYFEARLKFQRLQGHHGAFWLQSGDFGKTVDDPAKCGAEIDIFEFFGAARDDGGVACTVFWNNKPDQKKSTKQIDVLGPLGSNSAIGGSRPEISDAFHLYSLLWTEAGYQFFIDGIEVFRTAEGLSKHDEYVVLSLNSSSWERNRLDPSQLPDVMAVDYVRVYGKR
ncbi:MAG TPA: glycoside hydrolase family 16 protein [Pirellulales bacterium]|jgi:beta-glucanase (GH16 family)|nr:glycoside hydrolase family 16 protein [Pirellulales bacterium]